MTPSFIGLMATMLPGVRPSISFASLPTASTSPVFLLMATMDGSLTTMPLLAAKTRVFAVPRSMARSLEKTLKSDRKPCEREDRGWKPFDDMEIVQIREELLSIVRLIRCWRRGTREKPSDLSEYGSTRLAGLS